LRPKDAFAAGALPLTLRRSPDPLARFGERNAEEKWKGLGRERKGTEAEGG